MFKAAHDSLSGTHAPYALMHQGEHNASDMHSNMRGGHPARAEAEGVLEGVLDDRLLPRWGFLEGVFGRAFKPRRGLHRRLIRKGHSAFAADFAAPQKNDVRGAKCPVST